MNTGLKQQQALPELVLQNGHSRPVRSVAFPPNGKWIALGSNDNSIKLWDVNSKLLRLVSFQLNVNSSLKGDLIKPHAGTAEPFRVSPPKAEVYPLKLNTHIFIPCFNMINIVYTPYFMITS